MAKAQTDVLQSLVDRLHDIRRQAGDRLGHALADASVRERAAVVADKVEDLRAELTRSLRRVRPAAPAKPAAAPAKPAAASAKPPAGPPAKSAARPPAKSAARPPAKPAARPSAKPAARPSAKPVAERSTKALGDMTTQELRHLAAKRQIAGRSSMNKAELLEALSKK
jgi:Rho termination factor, N-terminal domain